MKYPISTLSAAWTHQTSWIWQNVNAPSVNKTGEMQPKKGILTTVNGTFFLNVYFLIHKTLMNMATLGLQTLLNRSQLLFEFHILFLCTLLWFYGSIPEAHLCPAFENAFFYLLYSKEHFYSSMEIAFLLTVIVGQCAATNMNGRTGSKVQASTADGRTDNGNNRGQIEGFNCKWKVADHLQNDRHRGAPVLLVTLWSCAGMSD